MVSLGTWFAIATSLYALPSVYIYTICTVTTWTAVLCYKKLLQDKTDAETGGDVRHR